MTTDNPRCPCCVEGDGFKLLRVVDEVLYCDRCDHQSLPGNPDFICYCLRCQGTRRGFSGFEKKRAG